ncbi:hypothetical protein J6590_044973 [Homalodisca vitripennis]|nr:hypothetical protein J6590_044973 [Homalodisca vitripennis]
MTRIGTNCSTTVAKMVQSLGSPFLQKSPHRSLTPISPARLKRLSAVWRHLSSDFIFSQTNTSILILITKIYPPFFKIAAITNTIVIFFYVCKCVVFMRLVF